MKIKYILILIVALGGVVSCTDEFLDVKPKGIILPEKVVDYEHILNSPTLVQTFPIILLDLTDDISNSIDDISQTPTANAYYWRRVITVDEKADPDIWGPLYKVIYDTNVIIDGVMDAEEGSEEDKLKVLGEALVIRANTYLELLTVFAKAYNPATASTDLGLPLVTSTNVTDPIPDRSTLKATVDAMINDVKTAIEDLPETNINRYRVTKYAAYGLLSRIYLYMGDFPNAKIYTELALQGPHTLLDYNSYTDKNEVPVYDLNPEVLWQRQSKASVYKIYSDDLNSYFDETDIRYEFLTITNNNNDVGRSPFLGRYSFGSSYPEMYLTKAELLAREGKFVEAMEIVNDLRKNRIRTNDYVDQIANTGEEALQLVFAERRRELAFSGLRWFDMKRLDQEGRMPTVTRTDPDTMEVQATLAPNSPNYTFEIPIRVQLYNPSMQLNF